MAEHGISDAELETIRAVLAECDDEITQVDLFGSRATGKHRSHSDIDLVIYGAVREAAIDRLRTLFIESNLPVSVDIFNYDGITCLPLKEHVDTVRQRLFTAQDIQGSGDRSMRDRRGSAIVEFMTANLKPYPNMKDSGVEALGQVPAHWDVLRLRNVTEMRVSNVDKHSRQKEAQVSLCNYVDVYKNDRIRPGMPFMRATATADEIERFGLRSGDVLITKDSEVWNDIGVPALVEGTEETSPRVVSGYHLALLRPYSERTHSGYLFRSLQSTAISSQLHVQANGVTRFGLTRGAIKAVRMPLPPLHEQAAIVRFLDHADRHIQRYIRARQKLIALLAEQKQAIIHQAVTGKIDVRTSRPYSAYKASGVEWLRTIPKHWSVRRMKSICSSSALYGANLPASSYADAGVRFLRTTDITEDGQLRAEGVFVPADLVRDYILSDGNLLISRSGTIGRSFIYDSKQHDQCAYAGYLIRFIADKNVVMPKYLFWFTKTRSFGEFLRVKAISSTIENINGEKYGNCSLPVPSLSEQTAIVRFLDHTERLIRHQITATRKLIALLEEFRTRLTADVIVGRIDVREVSSSLPVEQADK